MSKQIDCDKCEGTGKITVTALASLRNSKNLTQQEVADYLKMGRTAYAMVELGKANFLASRIPSMAELFDVTADELLSVMFEEQTL